MAIAINFLMCMHLKEKNQVSMDPLTIYGLISVALMLLFYSQEERSNWFVLAFALSCVLASIYGFLQGAWPFGMVEAIWSFVAVKRWRQRSKSKPN